MISKARVYLSEDRTRAVPEGHKDAKFLLVAEGGEIVDSQLERYKGAKALVAGKAAAEDDDDDSDAVKARVAQRLKEQQKAKGHRASD